MKVGFTGTRKGMTEAQATALAAYLRQLDQPIAFHHGACVGADEEAVVIAICNQDCYVVAHPGEGYPPLRSRASMRNSHDRHEELPYLERNRVIVNETDILVACPAEMTEQQRGGTWSTVRFARKQGKRVVLILPDGTVEG